MKASYLSFKLAFTLILVIATSSYLSGQISTIEVSGNITENTTWDHDTVKVTGGVTVDNNATLTINPGTYVEFQGHFALNVYGTIKAIGNPGDSIVFTINDTTGYGDFDENAGKWRGFNFEESGVADNTNHLSHCLISYADTGIYIRSDQNTILDHSTLMRCSRDGLYSWSSSAIVQIQNCFITEINETALFIWNNYNAVVKDNEISYCRNGIQFGYSNGIQITHNIIKNNSSIAGGSAIWGNYSDNIQISFNKIHDNIELEPGQWGGGGIFIVHSYTTTIDHNTFYNNSASVGGAISSEESELLISNNIICNNTAAEVGGGIYFLESEATMINNTICNNMPTGMDCRSSETSIYNSIIRGNETFGIVVRDVSSSPDIYHTNLESGLSGIDQSASAFNGIYENNLDADPRFLSPTVTFGTDPDALISDWNLGDSSLCINMGTQEIPGSEIDTVDVGGNQRIHNGQIDMGALEKRIGEIFIDDGLVSNSVTWTADTIMVNDNILIEYGATLTISPGAKIFMPENRHIRVIGTLLAQGTVMDTIFFDVVDTTGIHDPGTNAGSWRGIEFRNDLAPPPSGDMNSQDSSLIKYCLIRHIKYGPGIDIHQFSNLRIEYSVIESVHGGRKDYGGGISCNFGNPVIRNTTIRNNFRGHGAGIYLEQSDALIENCTITNNKYYGISMVSSSPIIKNSLFTDNYWAGIEARHSNPLIVNCKFINNRNGDALKIDGGNSIIMNCLISNNGTGVELWDVNDALIVNSTIVNNQSRSINLVGSKVKLFNTILWNNTPFSFYSYLPGDIEVNIYNCIIENGIAQHYFTQGYINDYESVIELSPQFVSPRYSSGYDEDIFQSDWRISSFSPAINSGTQMIYGVTLPVHDLGGMPRFNAELIDIGAYENQAGILSFLSHPTGGTYCEGDSAVLIAIARDTAGYQWQKDGIDIPGATEPLYTISPAAVTDQGNYRCKISNSYGSTFSDATTVFVIELPGQQIIQRESWVEPGKEVQIKTYAEGSNISFQWKKDGEIITGASLPEYSFTPADSSDEGNYTCIVSNICNTTESEPVSIYLAPQICMVTISETTGNNLVVWEKNSNAAIMAFNVYRESVAAGIYDLMATIPYDDLSVFVDTSADPTVQAYLYKITAIDLDDYETDIDLCKPHKTIHLIVSTNPELNTTQLQWDMYYGFDYQTYTIYKSTTGMNFDPVHSMSASLNSWTDPSPVSGDLFYRIAVEKPDPCVPEGNGKKAGTGPFVHSLSNMDDNKLKAGQMPPDTITISSHTIEEELNPGSFIGKLFTRDLDSLDSHTYKFVPGYGSDDNISFTITGDLLLTSESFDYETKNQYKIRIRATDEAGNYCEVTFIINIIDINEATGLPVIRSGFIRVFPNPFRQSAIIDIPNSTNEPYTLTLFDLSGKVCRIVDNISTSQYVLERGFLESGQYFIELRGPEIFRGKLMVE